MARAAHYRSIVPKSEIPAAAMPTPAIAHVAVDGDRSQDVIATKMQLLQHFNDLLAREITGQLLLLRLALVFRRVGHRETR